LYQRGFFPTPGDESLFEAFHAAAPDAKRSIAEAMTDDRARRLVTRIMYNEWPQALPADECVHASIRSALRAGMVHTCRG
jgi:hypothetical protein